MLHLQCQAYVDAFRHRPRRKLKLLPVGLKALRLHGRYFGYMRQLKSRAKAEVRALRAKKGVKAGIKGRQVGAAAHLLKSPPIGLRTHGA